MTEPLTDVCVIGAGPSGTIAALELMRLGLRVTILHRPAERPHWPESVSPQLLLLIQQLGLDEALASAACGSVTEKWMSWNGERATRAALSGATIIDRKRFEHALRSIIVRGGAEMAGPAAGHPMQLPDGTWHVRLAVGARVHARFVVIATGRGGRGFDEPAGGGQPLIACYGIASDRHDETGTMIVGSLSTHWYWGVVLADGSLHITVFKRARGPKVSPELLLEQSLRSFGGGSRVRFVRATDATARTAASPAGDGWIRTGDAALSVDPLTSSGLYLAALSSVRAARVINTVMRRPRDAAHARAFYTTAQADIARHCGFFSNTFYQSGMRGDASETEAAASPMNGCSLGVEDWVLSPDIHLEPVPVLAGDFITQVAGLKRSDNRPLAFLEGISIADLLAPLRRGKTLGEAARGWATLSPTKGERVQRLLIQEGIVVRKRAV
jgi:flavin-dependent dehydrogenase